MKEKINWQLWFVGAFLAFFMPKMYMYSSESWRLQVPNVPLYTVEIVGGYRGGSFPGVPITVKNRDGQIFLYNPPNGWELRERDIDEDTLISRKGGVRMFFPFVLKRPPEKIVDFSYNINSDSYIYIALLEDGTIWVWQGDLFGWWIINILGIVINIPLFIVLVKGLRYGMAYALPHSDFLSGLDVKHTKTLGTIFPIILSLLVLALLHSLFFFNIFYFFFNL